jgi:hypothetical protein
MKTDFPLRVAVTAYALFVAVLAVWLAVAPTSSPRHAPHAPRTVQTVMHGRPATCVLTVDSRGNGSLNQCTHDRGETR